MTVTVTALVPVLTRPHRVAPLVESFRLSVASEENVEASLLFLLSPGDVSEIAAVEESGAWHMIVPWHPGPGDYARKINFGVRATTSDWMFTGADDLVFHGGWLRACINAHIKTGALVIGTNDMMNPAVMRGQAATHSLVHRSYLDRAVIDAPGDLLCELYSHNCVDSELIETARHNSVFVPALDAHVEHLHPTWRRAPDDAVYRKGRAQHGTDRRLFSSRRKLWGDMTPSRYVMATPADGTPRPVGRWPRR
jgi:hypothetical protein